jgi:phytoene synthase
MTDRAQVQAIEDVKARVNASGTSFHAGMAVLPKARREAMYALYAFCREVDDIADDSPSVEISSQGLQQWRENIKALFQGQSCNTITSALMPAVTNYHLVESDFQAIIDGMAMDAGAPICAPSMEMLDLYCDRVASAVGRVSVRIFGDSSPKAMEVSHHLGRALQLTNILRDLHEDAVRGRLYLPAELLNKHNIVSRNPAEILKYENLRAVCRDLARQAQIHFDGADAAMKQCIPAAMRPAKIMRAYYGAIFDRLVVEDWQNPTKRISLPKWQKIWLVLKNLLP